MAPRYDEFLAAVPGPRRSCQGSNGERGCMLRCPAHRGDGQSLHAWDGAEAVGLRCFAHHGCSYTDILTAAGFPPDVPDRTSPTSYPPSPSSTPSDGWSASSLPPTDLAHPTLGRPDRAWELRDEEGRLFGVHCRWDRLDGKEIRWWRDGGWGLGGIPTADAPLYGTEHAATFDRSRPVFLVEGERATDALRQIGVQALGTVTGASSRPSPASLETLAGRSVILWPDHDEPGREHMRRIAAALPGTCTDLRLFAPDDLPPAGDAVEWLEAHADQAPERLLETLEAAGAPIHEPSADEVPALVQPADLVEPLAALGETPSIAEIEACLRSVAGPARALDDLGRELLREQLIRGLKGKVQAPGRLVDSVLKREGTSGSDRQGTALRLEPVVPAEEPVDGSMLLDALEQLFGRYLMLPDGSVTALALWTLHTFTHASASVSPLLAISSPEKRCGKTTLLTLLRSVVYKPLSASNITPAALFRAVEAYEPTLLIDEADAFLREREELRGILNSGHTRSTAFVLRTSGDDHEPRMFSTWGPKAVALIGRLPSTLEDRAIELRMKRKAPDETVERLRLHRLEALTEPLRRQAARWAADHLERLEEIDPSVPAQLHDRAADNWRPLLAIADRIGREWPGRARSAAVTLAGQAGGESSVLVDLLADLRAAFDERQTDQAFSSDLVEALIADESRPWGEWRGKALTANALARLLRPLGIQPRKMRIGDGTRQGYSLADFADAFARYLPMQLEQPEQRNGISDLDEITNRNTGEDVPVARRALSPMGTGNVPVVPVGERDVDALGTPPATETADGWSEV